MTIHSHVYLRRHVIKMFPFPEFPRTPMLKDSKWAFIGFNTMMCVLKCGKASC